MYNHGVTDALDICLSMLCTSSKHYDYCDDIIDIDVLSYCLKVLPFKYVTGLMGPEQRRIKILSKFHVNCVQ